MGNNKRFVGRSCRQTEMGKVCPVIFFGLLALVDADLVTEKRAITIDDDGLNGAGLGLVDRTYTIVYPEDLQPNFGVIFYLHGWKGSAAGSCIQTYKKYAQEYNFMFVCPQGMGDMPGHPTWNAWSLYTPCDPEDAAAEGYPYCYESCDQLGLCGACSKYSCHNDVPYIQGVVDEIIEDFGEIDESKFVIIGGSNGGMMTYWLSGKLEPAPSHFIPEYGNVPENTTVITDGKANLMTFYPRQDTRVPMNGGESYTGFWYTSESENIENWRDQSECDLDAEMLPFEVFPYTPGDKDMACTTNTGCNGHSIITSCHYEGTHGAKPDEYVEQQLWWVYNYTASISSSSETLMFPTVFSLVVSFLLK